MTIPIVALTPFTTNTPGEFLTRCMNAVAAQDYPGITHLLMPNNYPAHPQQFGNHARARNQMLDAIGKGQMVLWVDADIIDIPTNAVSTMLDHIKDGHAYCVAPQVRIERVANLNAAHYNDQFYDINGFIFGDGRNVSPDWRPVNDDLIPMRSVGCMYLLHWEAFRHYEPVGNEVEHISFFSGLNRWVYLDPTITVWHANLPAYGLRWH